jgi:flagellar operon protein (TIGR03826 family)
MPDIRNCRKCGKIYNYLGGPPICSVCRQEEEEDFQRVKKYLYENPGASMTQVSTELDISIEKIKRFLKEGRLEIAGDDGNLVLECENCGKSIKSGRYCAECERMLAASFKSAADQMRIGLNQQLKEKSFGMRYLNKEYEKKD